MFWLTAHLQHLFDFLTCFFTHFVTLIGKSFLPTHPVFLTFLSRDVTKLLYFNLATLTRLSARCLTHLPTIVHLPISVTKWVWMVSLTMCTLIECINLLCIQHTHSSSTTQIAGFTSGWVINHFDRVLTVDRISSRPIVHQSIEVVS